MIRVLVAGHEDPRWEAIASRATEAVFTAHGIAHGELSVTFLDDSGIRELHRRYLGRDRPTDVLSFPLFDRGEPVLGDVYVGLDQVRRQAEELGVPVAEEVARMVVHGALHVLGHDHPEDPDDRATSPFFEEQERLVRQVVESWERPL